MKMSGVQRVKYYYHCFYIIIVSIRFFQVISDSCHIDTVVNLMQLILAYIDIIEFRIAVVKSGRAYHDLVIISSVSHWLCPLTSWLQQRPPPKCNLKKKKILPDILKAENKSMCPSPRSVPIQPVITAKTCIFCWKSWAEVCHHSAEHRRWGCARASSALMTV